MTPHALLIATTLPLTGAAEPVTLIDLQLRRSPAVIESVSPRELSARIEGAPHTTGAERWLGWMSKVEPPAGGPVLALTDGQRFFGAPAGAGDEVVRWQTPGAGVLEAPLDRIDRIVLAPRLDPGPSTALGDIVILTNGDRLEGFVASIGDRVSIEVDGRAIEAPIQRCAVIDLANPPVPRSGAYMWLATGSVVRLRIDQDRFLLDAAPSGWDAQVGARPGSAATGAGDALSRARAFCFDASRIGALSEQPLTAHEPIERRWTAPPEIGDEPGAPYWAAPITLPGPMRAVWSLPEGATAFGAVAALREDSRVWGDCMLVIAQRRAGVDVELKRIRLHAAEPEIELTVGLGEGDLVISVEPGPSGPIQDRVRLDGALLLLEAPE